MPDRFENLRSARAIVLALGVSLALLVASSCAGDDDGGANAALATTTTATITSKPTTTTTAPTAATRGTYAVGKRTQTFVDSSRATDANHSYKGAPNRTLLTTIWYPALGDPTKNATADTPADTEHGPYPLVLMSHGFTALGSVYGAIASQWASAGYVVAAPDYPLSNNKAPGGPVTTDTKNQPADASFVIDQMIATDKSLFGGNGIIDRDHIGAAGHSLGAITTYGLAYSDCCRDGRIDAAISMSGTTILVDAPDHYFHGTTTPLLAVHGDADETLPYSLEKSTYARATKPKFFVTFKGGSHVRPYIGGDDAQAESFYEFTTAFLDRYLKGDAEGLTRLRTAVATPGANATLQEDGA
ncbi:MAG: hypothetical protein QOF64_3185 [Candidatus Binatota bacterium]|nr:hypothetical protein [Candidatus Binatota bacterium]